MGGFMKIYIHGKEWDGKLPLPPGPEGLAALKQEITAIRSTDKPSYQSKMMHEVPKAPEVDRNQLICDMARDKVVVDLGASGALHQEVLASAAKVHGLDLSPDSPDVTAMDLDDPALPLPIYPNIKLIIAGEIIEHLTNPGSLLARLRAAYPDVPLIISVPNAFSRPAQVHMQSGVENINKDHVAWYSFHTLSWLLARHGYTIKHWAWYNGPPLTAEGIVAVAE